MCIFSPFNPYLNSSRLRFIEIISSLTEQRVRLISPKLDLFFISFYLLIISFIFSRNIYTSYLKLIVHLPSILSLRKIENN